MESKIKTFYDKYRSLIIIGAILIVFLSVRSCVNTQYDKFRGENSILAEQVEVLKDGTAVAEQLRLRVKDSTNYENARKLAENEKLSMQITFLKREVELRKQIPKATPQNNNELTEYFNKNYNTVETEILNEKIGLTTRTAKEVVADIEQGKEDRDVNIFQVKQIGALEKKVGNLEDVYNNTNSLLSVTEGSLKSYQELSRLQERQTQGLKNENRKLKVKNVLTTILIPAAFALGTQIK